MKNFFSLFTIIIIIQFFLSCNQTSRSQKRVDSYPESGKIHEGIICTTSPGYSYTLYLPKAFPGKNSWPVIIWFDPHGNGSLPVKRYFDLAEKHGYIILGSNNSKNGLPAEEIRSIVNILVDEILQVFPVDTGRMYAAGFSGGSRVASSAAMLRKEIKGVIACGAGLSSSLQVSQCNFDYFGIAGTADFNMAEMVQLDEQFTNMGVRHFLKTYPGSHSWPPVEIMEEGLLWHHFNAMKDGLIPKDNALIDHFRDSVIKRTERARESENFLLEAELLKEAISFLENLLQINPYRQELASVENSAGYKKQLIIYNNILLQEQQEQQNLIHALFSRELPWWEGKIKEYGIKMKRYGNPEDTLMIARLKAYMSLLCYSNLNAAMKQNQHEVAKKLVAIYTMVDPDNPEPYYVNAVIKSWEEDSAGCFTQLNTAILKGFSDKGRMMQQPEFEDYRNTPGFFDLIQKIR